MLRRGNVNLSQDPKIFQDRATAGQMLVEPVQALLKKKGLADEEIVVLGLPKRGISVSAPVAAGLKAPLDLIVTRKLYAPKKDDLVIGAVTERGQAFLNKMVIDALQISDEELKEAIDHEKEAIRREIASYRAVLPQTELTGKTIVLVDDNVITGSTVFATLRGLWAERPKNVILAVPVGPKDTLDSLSEFVDYIVALNAPPGNRITVSDFYESMEEATEREVIELLKHSLQQTAPVV